MNQPIAARFYQNERDLMPLQVLLMDKIAIDCDQNIERVGCQSYKLSILFPAQPISCAV